MGREKPIPVAHHDQHMAQRSDQLQTDVEVGQTEQSDDGLLSRSDSSSSSIFSPRAFLFALVLTVVGLFVGGAIVPFVDFLGGLLGVFAAGLGLGVARDQHRYVEVGLAGLLAAGGAFAIGHLTWMALGFGVPLAAIGAGTGLVAAVAGHYFGRDLRAGLTESI